MDPTPRISRKPFAPPSHTRESASRRSDERPRLLRRARPANSAENIGPADTKLRRAKATQEIAACHALESDVTEKPERDPGDDVESSRDVVERTLDERSLNQLAFSIDDVTSEAEPQERLQLPAVGRDVTDVHADGDVVQRNAGRLKARI